MKDSYFHKEIAFDREADRYLFRPLEDDELSDIERYLRFVYAVKTTMKHVRNSHIPSRIDMPISLSFPDPVDYKHWIPQKGRPYLLTSKITDSNLTLPWRNQFSASGLYGQFKSMLANTPRHFELHIESAYDVSREFEGIANMFRVNCNTKDWREELTKMAAKWNSNGNGNHRASVQPFSSARVPRQPQA